VSPVEEEFNERGIKFARLYVTGNVVKYEEHIEMRVPEDLRVSYQTQEQGLYLIRILCDLVHLVRAHVCHLLLCYLTLEHHLP